MKEFQKWGLYGDPLHKQYQIRISELIPGMWFATNPDAIPHLASRELCREVDDEVVRADTYVAGEKVGWNMVYDLKEDPERLTCFIVDEQPWVIVKELCRRYGPIIRWQGVLEKSSPPDLSQMGIQDIEI
jgi:pimeloyl-CoA synthetase